LFVILNIGRGESTTLMSYRATSTQMSVANAARIVAEYYLFKVVSSLLRLLNIQ